MARMRAVDAAVRVLEKEGIRRLRRSGRRDQSVLRGDAQARHDPPRPGAPRRGRLAHGGRLHPRRPGNIGVCIGTSGPAGTDMITGLYAAAADSIPILCITGQAPRARLYKEDFQAVDIESIAKPVTKWAVTVREPALVPRVFQQAFHVMRSGRPGPVLIDLPIDVQMAEIEFDIDTYRAAAGLQARGDPPQTESASRC